MKGKTGNRRESRCRIKASNKGDKKTMMKERGFIARSETIKKDAVKPSFGSVFFRSSKFGSRQFLRLPTMMATNFSNCKMEMSAAAT